jgi:FSR family fosmidomycin resistance protein-like MFS transporter
VNTTVKARSARNLAFASLGHFVNDGSTFFVPTIAAVLALRPGIQAAEVSAMLVVFYATSVGASLLIGRRADRTGRPGPMLGGGLALLALGLVLFGVSMAVASGVELALLSLVSALVAGVGSAFYHPLSATILRSSFSDETRGRVLGIAGAVGSVGRMLYPALFLVLVMPLTENGSIAFFGVLGIVLSTAVWMGLRKETILARDRTDPDPAGERTLNRGIVALSVVGVLRGMAEVGMVAWVPTFIGVVNGASVQDVGVSVTVMYAAGILGQPLFGALADRFDNRYVLGLTSFGVAAFILAFLLIPGPLVLLFLFIFGLFSLNSFVLILSAAADYEAAGAGTTSNALVWGLGTTVGAALGPFLIGLIILNDYSRLSVALPIMAVVSAVAGVLSLLLPRPRRARRVPPDPGPRLRLFRPEPREAGGDERYGEEEQERGVQPAFEGSQRRRVSGHAPPVEEDLDKQVLGYLGQDQRERHGDADHGAGIGEHDADAGRDASPFRRNGIHHGPGVGGVEQSRTDAHDRHPHGEDPVRGSGHDGGHAHQRHGGDQEAEGGQLSRAPAVG